MVEEVHCLDRCQLIFFELEQGGGLGQCCSVLPLLWVLVSLAPVTQVPCAGRGQESGCSDARCSGAPKNPLFKFPREELGCHWRSRCYSLSGALCGERS